MEQCHVYLIRELSRIRTARFYLSRHILCNPSLGSREKQSWTAPAQKIRLTAGCDSAVGLAESAAGPVSSEMDPLPRASQGETRDCCRILGGPWLVPGESYGWMGACLVSAANGRKTFLLFSEVSTDETAAGREDHILY